MTFDDVMQIVETLRDPGGCPWDREQTHESLRPHLLEECYEAIEAIDAGDAEGLAEELGDLLTHIAFHADMARRAGAFEISDIFRRVVDKLRRRHPHVFGSGPNMSSSDEVVEQWDAIKRRERGAGASVLDGVPAAMPALAYAATLQRRAASMGFAHEQSARRGALAAPPSGGRAASERAAGDTLFEHVAELAGAGIDAETALRHAAVRFRERVRRAESAAGRPLDQLSKVERERLWREANP